MYLQAGFGAFLFAFLVDFTPMENQLQHPKPLRVVKTPPLSRLGVGPISCYPRIPGRRSSLRAVSRACSGQSATSMRTPSLGDDFNRLQILKTRVNTGVLSKGLGDEVDDIDDLDEVFFSFSLVVVRIANYSSPTASLLRRFLFHQRE